MAMGLEDDYEQVIDAFATEGAAEEMVHVIQNDLKANDESMEDDGAVANDNADGMHFFLYRIDHANCLLHSYQTTS